jgi:purine-binding chemotaxis protein CheW
MNSSPGKRSPQEILRTRARAMAVEPARADSAGPAISLVEFGLADERYGIELSAVVEIHPLEQLTPVPCTPAFILGIINVRGRIVAVVDIKKFFDLPEKGITDLHRVIIVQHGEVELGILADYVIGTRIVPLDALQPAPATLSGIRRDYLKGTTGERLVVLDVAQLLSDPKLFVNEDPAA